MSIFHIIEHRLAKDLCSNLISTTVYQGTKQVPSKTACYTKLAICR